MWFKKKSQISGYNPNTAYDGSDWRTVNKYQSWSASYTLPDATDANNYFYLPALGFYSLGRLRDVGGGYYWSSSFYPGSSSDAYGLYFYSGGVDVSANYGNAGWRVGGFE